MKNFTLNVVSKNNLTHYSFLFLMSSSLQKQAIYISSSLDQIRTSHFDSICFNIPVVKNVVTSLPNLSIKLTL